MLLAGGPGIENDGASVPPVFRWLGAQTWPMTVAAVWRDGSDDFRHAQCPMALPGRRDPCLKKLRRG